MKWEKNNFIWKKQLVEEFDLMRALLISMGIPEQDIILSKQPSRSLWKIFKI